LTHIIVDDMAIDWMIVDNMMIDWIIVDDMMIDYLLRFFNNGAAL